MTVRVRFAPSPTGQMHVGNARTALFNWLFARVTGGVFVLRIEDTDLEREQAGAVEAIFRDLSWLGLDWDEGPVPREDPDEPRRDAGGAARKTTAIDDGGTDGPAASSGSTSPAPEALGARSETMLGDRGLFGPYMQSLRRNVYEPWYESLLRDDRLYPCFCSEARLDEDRRLSLAAGRTPGYSGRCASIDREEGSRRRAAGEPHVLRFRVGRYGVVRDLLRGEIDFRTREVFDPVVRRRSGRPTYNFAVVVDDAAMKITHVLRGEDHLTNTALQMRLYEAMGLAPPIFAHFPLIMGPDGTPLSKRHGATSVSEFRERGYPPEALVNSLVLLGWTPPEQKVLLERQEMIGLFELERVHPTPAIFDVAKLDWISAQKIRAMDPARRARAFGEALVAAGVLPGTKLTGGEGPGVEAWLRDLASLLASAIERFDQVPGHCGFVFSFDPAAAVAAGALEGEGACLALETFERLIETAGGVFPDSFPAIVEEAKTRSGLKGRALLHPLRAAATGHASGPELSRVLPLIDAASRLGLSPDRLGVAGRIRQVLDLALRGPA